MSGSGTVLRMISELGYTGLGFDLDPLAVLLSKAWTSKIEESNFIKRAYKILYLSTSCDASIPLKWVDEDLETKRFIDFWFASKQMSDLRKLSYHVNQDQSEFTSLLKIALSKLIITKSRGASLAADVSHSRPHRVKETNDFDVISEFEKVCLKISGILKTEKLLGKIDVRQGDARKLTYVRSKSVDSIITSPPYLNALDYMRGHKLALVWLGYKIGDLSAIKSESVGAEKAPNIGSDSSLSLKITKDLYRLQELPKRKIAMVNRYALDMHQILKESARVLKTNANATFVVGNSSLQNIYIENTRIVENSAKLNGFTLIQKTEREIPQNRRYLPPPTTENRSGLDSRMRTETVMTFQKNR